MSVGRFKSKDDYFSRKSGFAERVIQAKPQKYRKKALETTIPATLLRVHFCKTMESFEIEGEGKFLMGEYSLDEALSRHLEGNANVLVNPLSQTGETAFSLVKFDLSPEMDLPFSKVRQYADELLKLGISSQIEVTAGGKGHYHLLIFHEEPILGRPFSEALVRFGHELFGIYLDTVPLIMGDAYVPLPLQGEDVLLQRRVFVNAVGKMIRDQAQVLRDIEPCPKKNSEAFIRQVSRASASSLSKVIVSLPEPKVDPTPPLHVEKPTVQEKPKAHLPEPASIPEMRTATPLEESAPRQAAIPLVTAEEGEKVVILTFMRSGKIFGIETVSVQEIIPLGRITRIPGMPPPFCGITTVGQRVISLIDVGILAGQTSSINFSLSRIIKLRDGDKAYGILADSISGTESIEEGEIQPSDLSEYFRGKVVREGSKSEILLLDKVKFYFETSKKKVSIPEKVESDGCGQYVLFSHGSMLFGLETHAVIEFLPAIPGRDKTGFISAQGKFLPLVELPFIWVQYAEPLQSLSALVPKRMGSPRFLVVQSHSSTFSVKADYVIGIRNIPSSRIEPIPVKQGKGIALYDEAPGSSGEKRFVSHSTP